jgi:hypothetical protein
LVLVRGCIPSFGGEVDTTAERHRIVDDNDLLVVDGADRMCAVDGELYSPAADLIQKRHGREPGPKAVKRREQTQIGPQQIGLESRPLP